MCRHTREPTVLSRLSCRPHLNVDRFHQPCLLPGRPSRIGEDCRPRTTWRPLTPFGAARLFLLCVSLVFFLPRRLDGTTAGCKFILPLPACATLYHRCLHTRSFGTLAGPPPPVVLLPWRHHLLRQAHPTW